MRTETPVVEPIGRRFAFSRGGVGEVAVVFESGWDQDRRVWSGIFRDLADSVRVLAYDRAGTGRSESSPLDRTPDQIVEELRLVLRESGTGPPYVLVGSGLGTLYVQRFVALYPLDVVGLVLVDPWVGDPGMACALPPGSTWCPDSTAIASASPEARRELAALGPEAFSFPAAMGVPLAVVAAPAGAPEIDARGLVVRGDPARFFATPERGAVRRRSDLVLEAIQWVLSNL